MPRPHLAAPVVPCRPGAVLFSEDELRQDEYRARWNPHARTWELLNSPTASRSPMRTTSRQWASLWLGATPYASLPKMQAYPNFTILL
jgi:hypothetical protein